MITEIANISIEPSQHQAFAHWRGIARPFFANPPVVEHFETLG